MGWMYVNRQPRTKIADFFKEVFDYDNENCKGEVLECKVVHRREAYIAYKITNKTDNTEKVIAVVCLLDYRNHDYHNFGYKDMSEDMHPYYYNCPASVFNLLSCTDNENSNKWRLTCVERAIEKEKERIARKERRKRLKEAELARGW